jgi:hypothetical protein
VNKDSQWEGINVSYLTTELVEYIDAPIPYIIGIPRSVWREIKKLTNKQEILEDVVIFDIDKAEFIALSSTPEWPKESEVVYRCLQDVITEGNELKFVQKSIEEKDVLRHNIVSILKIKEAFFKLYIKLLGNYLNYYKDECFDYEQYINAQRLPFIKELIKTESFKHFIEISFNCTQKRNELDYFLEGVKIMAKKGERGLTHEIHKITNKVLHNYDNVFFI